MAFRSLLLRLLLLAAFFNAAVGMPMHEAGHLQGLVAGASQVTDTRAARSDGEPSEVAEADRLCAWCAAYAAQGMAPASGTPFALPTEVLAPQPAGMEASFAPQGWQWRFAARDPPLALT